MTAIILGAGYATRLYPMTLGAPKAMVRIGPTTLLDRIIDGLGPVERIIIISNSRFFLQFQEWLKGRSTPAPTTLWSDRTGSDADKLGAMADLARVILELNLMQEDLVVIAPDNLFSQPLSRFVEVCQAARLFTPIIGIYDVLFHERARQYGVVTLADHDPEPGPAERLVASVVEKPAHPSGTLVAVGLYYFPKFTVPLIPAYVDHGNPPDQPGRFIQWLCETKVVPVRAWPVPGLWFDIGSKESLNAANTVFKNEHPDTTGS
jgi:glucose-1-phosphate thymidylyltransferase